MAGSQPDEWPDEPDPDLDPNKAVMPASDQAIIASPDVELRLEFSADEGQTWSPNMATTCNEITGDFRIFKMYNLEMERAIVTQISRHRKK